MILSQRHMGGGVRIEHEGKEGTWNTEPEVTTDQLTLRAFGFVHRSWAPGPGPLITRQAPRALTPPPRVPDRPI